MSELLIFFSDYINDVAINVYNMIKDINKLKKFLNCIKHLAIMISCFNRKKK